VIRHEAESVDTVPEPLGPLLQQEVETSPVPVIEEDGLPRVAAQGDVIERHWILYSWLTSHGLMLNNKLLNCKPHMFFPGQDFLKSFHSVNSVSFPITLFLDVLWTNLSCSASKAFVYVRQACKSRFLR